MWDATLYDTTKVTIELRDVVESGVKVWDFDYPSFYEGNAKAAFEQKVLDHYWLRQIGHETVGRFLHQFRTKVREIMPYYQQLYKSVQLMEAIDDPFGNVNMTETFEETVEGDYDSTVEHDNTTSGNTTDKGVTKTLDTAQGAVSNLDNYLTAATKVDNENTVGGTDKGKTETIGGNTTTRSYTHTRQGNHGVNTYAHDMAEYRDILINIDMLVINDLGDLFLGVY